MEFVGSYTIISLDSIDEVWLHLVSELTVNSYDEAAKVLVDDGVFI